ncbi:hypothetical protein ACF0H5_021121 [Mactra antiquata]
MNVLLHTSRRYRHSEGSTKWTSNNVRKAFLDFFCQKNNHQFVKSSSVIPGRNQGTYFTNAGMNQFKPIFLGTVHETSDLYKYDRVANSQKCVRVGGKHNDLEDVGRDYTHHTFFEMLGSWSFGDYFKKEACSMALDLLLNVYNLPLDRLYFTYFGGCKELGLQPDLDCREIWINLGVPECNVLPFGMKDNFWDMGDTGPCGPCTEIHYDHIGNRNASHLVNTDHPDVIEIWNLVFMQYNRLGADKLLLLPNTHVDTGMGLERICAVLNNTRSNYNTDLFLPLFHSIQKETGVREYNDSIGNEDINGIDTAYRVISDHTRMSTICIADSLLPGRLDLGYKLRYVIYRALYQCHHILKAKPGLLGKLVDPVCESLGEAYPEVIANADKVKEVLNTTEERYLKFMKDGERNFDKMISKIADIKSLTETDIQRLHDGYYGNPMSTDMIEILANKYNLSIDSVEMEKFTSHQISTVTDNKEDIKYPSFTPDLLNTLTSMNIGPTNDVDKYNYSKSSDTKYDFTPLDGNIQCMIDINNDIVSKIKTGEDCGVILDHTMFYSEMGGQHGDKGIIRSQTGILEVIDTQYSNGFVLHNGKVTSGYIECNQHVTMEIDTVHRTGCMRNHTATHLLNSALRYIIGSDIKQCGSIVSNQQLSFDFTCWSAVNQDNIKQIENYVMEAINKRTPVQQTLMSYNDAIHIKDLVYLDNTDYPSDVYVISIDDNDTRSIELCGGTHVLNTGDIEDFCVVSLQGQSASIKSIICLTGQQATQAKMQAVEIEDLYTKLVDSIKHTELLDQSIDLYKHINMLLGTKVLPKVFRDPMTTKIEQIGSTLNTAINKRAFINLQKDLLDRMNGDENFIVHQFAIKVLPKLNKLMKSLVIQKPLLLVVETSNNISVYVALPKGRNKLRSEIVDSLCENISGRIVQTETNYICVSTKHRNIKHVVQCSNDILNNIIDKQSDHVVS